MLNPYKKNNKLPSVKNSSWLGMKKVTDIIPLEGNIGSGKTTIIRKIREYIETNGLCALSAPTSSPVPRDLFLLIDEPVLDWCVPNCSRLNSRGEGEHTELSSFLGLFYEGMEEEKYPIFNPFAFDFQVNAFTGRKDHIKQEIAKLPAFTPESNTRVHVISERSLRTDRLFFKNLYDSGKVAQYQWANYERFHKSICASSLKKQEMMIYVKTSPETCYDRIHHKRKRQAEIDSPIPLAYLRSLHNEHEEMVESFIEEKGNSDSVLKLDFERDMTDEHITSFVAEFMEKIKAK